MSYEDRTSYTVCDIHYQATDAEANAVSMAVDKLPAFKNYVLADQYVKMGHFDTLNKEGRRELMEAVEMAYNARALACRAVHSLLVKMELLSE